MDIKGKTIVITGAGQGLGQAMAVMLAQQGASLALVDLEQDRMTETVKQCRAANAIVRSYAANVAVESDVARLFEQVSLEFGRVDALINNAGTNADALLVKRHDSLIQKMSLDDFNRVVTVDLTGVFLCGREAAVQMLAAENPGVIINISSISEAGNVGQSNYAAAKAGVSALTVTWAQELARYAIRVAGIAPGFSETQMVRTMRPDMQEKFRQRIPLRRFAKPEEVAHAALFILENDYFNGRVLALDGGLRL
jgi:3-oxoacyl-[acyl-carrier protein] reductase